MTDKLTMKKKKHVMSQVCLIDSNGFGSKVMDEEEKRG